MPKPSKDAAPPPADSSKPLDPQAAEKAFHAVKQRLLGLDPEKLAARSVDLEKAAVAAAAVGRWVKEKEVRARFASLPKKYFDQAHVDDLEKIALAAWHAAVSLRSASAGKSDAKLPVSLVQKATSIKQRMLPLCEYHFGDDPVDGPEVADIKLGAGYGDLASDLLRLAKLYKKHRARVKTDAKYYVAGDEAEAGRTAHAILRELGEAKNQDQKAWTDLTLRAWTLLEEVYNEVAAAGAWLYRFEDAATRFTSIYTAGRSAPAKARKPPKGDQGKGGAEGGAGNG
jgi:hypothetical protein